MLQSQKVTNSLYSNPGTLSITFLLIVMLFMILVLVASIFKQCNHFYISNYRPNTVISAITKILDTILSTLNSLSNPNTSSHHVFVPGKSMSFNPLLLVDDIYKRFASWKEHFVWYLHFKKIFDLVVDLDLCKVIACTYKY